MDSDINIRHSIVTDIEGNILATSHRDGVRNYLSPDETASSLKRASSAWKGRRGVEWKNWQRFVRSGSI